MLSFFITDYEIANIPIVHTGDLKNKVQYYKIYYENKNVLNFFVCIPTCCKIKPIIYQEAIHT